MEEYILYCTYICIYKYTKHLFSIRVMYFLFLFLFLFFLFLSFSLNIFCLKVMIFVCRPGSYPVTIL